MMWRTVMSCIKTTQVVKTVTREVQEKSTCIDFLTKRICKDVATNELDKMLSQTGSPTSAPTWFQS